MLGDSLEFNKNFNHNMNYVYLQQPYVLPLVHWLRQADNNVLFKIKEWNENNDINFVASHAVTNWVSEVDHATDCAQLMTCYSLLFIHYGNLLMSSCDWSTVFVTIYNAVAIAHFMHLNNYVEVIMLVVRGILYFNHLFGLCAGLKLLTQLK